MGKKYDEWIEGKTPGYLGQGAAKSTDRPLIPTRPRVDPRDRALGYQLLRKELLENPPKEEDKK